MQKPRASIYDRLSDPSTFTGVYKERFKSGPGINADSSPRTRYSFGERKGEGHIHDIRELTRPYLNPGGSAAREPPPPRKSYAARSVLPSDSVTSPKVELDNNARLQLVFQYYCKFGRTGAKGQGERTLDNVNFAKFSRECPGLLDTHLTKTEVDLVFTRVKERTKRRITYSQFLDGLSQMAAIKYPGEDPVVAFSVLLDHHVFQCPASTALGASSPQPVPRSGSVSRRVAPPPAPTLQPPPPPVHRRDAQRLAQPTTVPIMDDPDIPVSYSARVLLRSKNSTAMPPPSSAAAAPATPDAAAAPAPAPSEPKAVDALLEGVPYVSTPIPAPFESAAASRVPRGSFSAPYRPPAGGPRTVPLPPTPEAAPAGTPPTDAARHRRTTSAGSRSKSLPVVPPEYLAGAIAAAGAGGGGGRPAPPTASGGSPAGPVHGGHHRSRSMTSTTSSKGPKVTYAGEANKPGGVYDRLSSPATFTGVYRRAYESDGRINHFTETGLTAKPTQYAGNTNTGTNEVIHDMKVLLRPNLKDGHTFKV